MGDARGGRGLRGKAGGNGRGVEKPNPAGRTSQLVRNQELYAVMQQQADEKARAEGRATSSEIIELKRKLDPNISGGHTLFITVCAFSALQRVLSRETSESEVAEQHHDDRENLALKVGQIAADTAAELRPVLKLAGHAWDKYLIPPEHFIGIVAQIEAQEKGIWDE